MFFVRLCHVLVYFLSFLSLQQNKFVTCLFLRLHPRGRRPRASAPSPVNKVKCACCERSVLMDNKRLFLRHHDQSICGRHIATIETTNQKAKPTNKPTRRLHFPKVNNTNLSHQTRHPRIQQNPAELTQQTTNQKHTKTYKTHKNTNKTTYHRRKCLWVD